MSLPVYSLYSPLYFPFFLWTAFVPSALGLKLEPTTPFYFQIKKSEVQIKKSHIQIKKGHIQIKKIQIKKSEIQI